MVKFLIHRPVAVTMAFLAFLLIGIATTTNLPVSLMPDIDIPVVSIRISSSELPARQLENTVVKTVRNLLKEVNHVEELKSETRDGSAWIELRFRHGTPIDLASVEVNEKVDKAMNFLPREMKRPEVIRASASDIPVFYLMINQKKFPMFFNFPLRRFRGGRQLPKSRSIFILLRSSTPPFGGQGGAWTRGGILSLSNFSSQVIRKRLEQLPEVALVDMSGLQHPEIKITPNKTFLQNGSFSVAQLEEALQNNNIDLGNLLIRDGQYQYNIRFNTRLRDVSDIENVPVNLNGKVVKLKELAEINLQSQKPHGNVNFNSNPAISLAVIKQSDAKMADLEKELDFLISRFREDYPNLEFSVTRDQSKLLKYSISNLGQSLIIGGLLAFLTMFVFLRERKAPWLIGISIPVSLIISLLLFYLTGLSINIISLSGLILGVGMMIDNSIIVIDNITQHRERNSQIHKSQKTTRTIETIETTETTETLEPSNLQTSSNPQTLKPSNPQTLKPSSNFFPPRSSLQILRRRHQRNNQSINQFGADHLRCFYPTDFYERDGRSAVFRSGSCGYNRVNRVAYCFHYAAAHALPAYLPKKFSRKNAKKETSHLFSLVRVGFKVCVPPPVFNGVQRADYVVTFGIYVEMVACFEVSKDESGRNHIENRLERAGNAGGK
jgi:Cu/Ag efflux pump CusA